MRGDVRTLATVAESRVSAHSMAVIFPALIYIEGVSIISDHLGAWAGRDRRTNGAEARLCGSAGVVDIVYFAVGTVGYLAGV